MSELTDRGKAFRAAIAGFIDARREAKLKGKEDDPETASKYEYTTWLADAARRVGQIQAVTHVLKATHPDARGSSLHAAPIALPPHAEIGSHLLGDDFAEDVVGNAAAAHFRSFLNIEVDGKRLVHWMRETDPDLKLALSDHAETATEWMQSFASLVRYDPQPSSHPLAKQVYWLSGGDPSEDRDYHLLQPLFASSLSHVVFSEVHAARFGEGNKEARQRFKAGEPHEVRFIEFRGIVEQHIGALPKATNKSKHLNVSHLNAERLGRNYLLSSLPPPAWQRHRLDLRNKVSAFEQILWFGDVRDRTRELACYLLSMEQLASTKGTKDERDALTDAIVEQFVLFGATVRDSHAAGWTRDPECRLPRCEQLWLDPDRTELPPRDDPQHPHWREDDDAFVADYHRGTWADEVAERFADWLNAQLHREGLVSVSLPERRHWASQAILDVAWPLPMQRRLSGGAA